MVLMSHEFNQFTKFEICFFLINIIKLFNALVDRLLSDNVQMIFLSLTLCFYFPFSVKRMIISLLFFSGWFQMWMKGIFNSFEVFVRIKHKNAATFKIHDPKSIQSKQMIPCNKQNLFNITFYSIDEHEFNQRALHATIYTYNIWWYMEER